MYWCYCVEVWPALPALWPCFIKSIMVNHVLFNYTKGEFSPVQFLGFWLFAISPLSAIVNPLFCVISGGSFFNPGKYWTFAMSAVRKLCCHSQESSNVCWSGEEGLSVPGVPQVPIYNGVRTARCQVSQGIRNLKHWFPDNKETIRWFSYSLSRKSQRYFLAFSKLETSFLKSGLIASSSSFCLALCLPRSEQVLPLCAQMITMVKWFLVSRPESPMSKWIGETDSHEICKLRQATRHLF